MSKYSAALLSSKNGYSLMGGAPSVLLSGPRLEFPFPPLSWNSVSLAKPNTSLRRRSGGLNNRES